MKIRVLVLVGVSLLLAGMAAVPYLVHREVQSRIGPRHVYELGKQPEALSEELAVAKARETLTRDGLDIASWQEYGGTRQVTSNRVVFMFTNGTASTRFVHVELDGSRVVCQTSVGK
jgi:hypothetical protein